MDGPFILMQSPDTTGSPSGQCEINVFTGVHSYNEEKADLNLVGFLQRFKVFRGEFPVYNDNGYVVQTNQAFKFILNPTEEEIHRAQPCLR
tara:strand:- start:175 stop:447 length:273 start_codon:yes stop_codon:yes gene_type:complete